MYQSFLLKMVDAPTPAPEATPEQPPVPPKAQPKVKPEKPKTKKKCGSKKGVKKNRQPTEMQKKVADIVADAIAKGKKMTKAQAIKLAGGSKGVQNKPVQVFSSNTFRGELKRLIPEKILAKTHADLLDARGVTTLTFPMGLEPEVISDAMEQMNYKLLSLNPAPMLGKWFAIVAAPNYKAIAAGLRMMYELLGEIKKEPVDDRTPNTLVIVKNLQLLAKGPPVAAVKTRQPVIEGEPTK